MTTIPTVLDPKDYPPYKPTSDNMYKRIQNGDYKPKGKTCYYPLKPRPSDFQTAITMVLTSAQARQYAEALDFYEIKMAEIGAFGKLYADYSCQFHDAFLDDLAAEFEYDPNDGFASAMYSMAYERGHSSGYSEIYAEMQNLSQLWNIYAVVKDENTELKASLVESEERVRHFAGSTY